MESSLIYSLISSTPNTVTPPYRLIITSYKTNYKYRTIVNVSNHFKFIKYGNIEYYSIMNLNHLLDVLFFKYNL